MYKHFDKWEKLKPDSFNYTSSSLIDILFKLYILAFPLPACNAISLWKENMVKKDNQTCYVTSTLVTIFTTVVLTSKCSTWWFELLEIETKCFFYILFYLARKQHRLK